MEELTILVERARAGDLAAYGELVRRFQDMAVGYAYSLLGDFHLAEDAAQEAFIQAHRDLSRLREPAAFPGWLRRIVFKYCDRLQRRKRVPSVPLQALSEIGNDDKGPAELFDQKEVRDRVSIAIEALPENQRLVVNLFYISEFSHAEIAAFLGAPVQTVKNRLHASKKRLKKELIDMTKKKLQQQRPSRGEAFVTQIMDGLVDISDRGIQYVLRRTDLKDCALALKGASEEVRRKILSNMSERVRNFIEEEIEALGDIDDGEIKRAQRLMMERLEEIKHKPPMKLTKEYRTRRRKLKKLLQDKLISKLDYDELTFIFTELSLVASHEGMLALEEFEELVWKDEDEKLLNVGLSRIISGREFEMNLELLEQRKRLLLEEHERRYRLIIDGIAQVQKRLDPFSMRNKLRAHYTLDTDV